MVLAVKRTGVLAVGLVTLWPPAYSVWFVATVLGPTFAGRDDPPLDETWFVALHGGTMLVAIGLLGSYSFHAVRNRRLSDKTRALWLGAIIFLGAVAMPVYWARHVWSADSRPATNR